MEMIDGNDKIYGLKGDIICGCKGNDVSYGDAYSDYPIAQLPNGDIPLSADFIFGQEGKDTIYGGAESDFSHGGIGEAAVQTSSSVAKETTLLQISMKQTETKQQETVKLHKMDTKRQLFPYTSF